MSFRLGDFDMVKILLGGDLITKVPSVCLPAMLYLTNRHSKTVEIFTVNTF